MPPVMARRKPIKVVLSEDPETINHDEDGANVVFTDISPSKDSRVSLYTTSVDYFCVNH